jgi:2-amino-4-hydroxy-6-hydroxymethyldihydropteridine diphosphokinase
MSRAFIAIGSNMGNPSAQVLQAFTDLGSLPLSTLIVCSSLYWSAPVGNEDQPYFINAVAEIETRCNPYALLSAMHQIEAVHGRTRSAKNGPRTLDLDLLLYDDLVLSDKEIVLPHPRMHERAFVLLPLIEIFPNCHIPGHDLARRCLANCNDQKVDLFQVAQMGM